MALSLYGITIFLVLSCAVLGGYAAMFTSYRHGFFEALRICTSNTSSSSSEKCVLDMSHSQALLPGTYTGVPSIDSLINILLEFFAQGLRSQSSEKGLDLEALLAVAYMASQFGGAWFLLVLEGQRRGNTATILSCTGTFGIIFQVVTITIIAPIYLVLQLLLSPQTPEPSAILIDPLDLNLLPISTIIAFVIPTVGLSLPLLNVLSREGNWLAIALWQPFPLYQTIVHSVLRLIRGRADEAGRISPRRYKNALRRAYGFVLWLTMGVHLFVLGIITTSLVTDELPEMSAMQILAPTSLTSPPTLALQSPPVSAMASRAVVVSFLRWDVYCACASLAIWAAYHLYSAQRTPSLTAVSFKAVLWTVLGGPIAPAVIFLWERDVTILDGIELSQIEAKTK